MARRMRVRWVIAPEFPKVKVNFTVDLSKYHDSRTDLSYLITKKEIYDVAFLQTVHDFPRWKMQGRLLPYKVAPWNSIFPKARDPDGYFFGGWICTSSPLPSFPIDSLDLCVNT